METITDEAANARIAIAELANQIGKTVATDEWEALSSLQQQAAGGVPIDEFGYLGYSPPEGSEYLRYPTAEEVYGLMLLKMSDDFKAPKMQLNTLDNDRFDSNSDLIANNYSTIGAMANTPIDEIDDSDFAIFERIFNARGIKLQRLTGEQTKTGLVETNAEMIARYWWKLSKEVQRS